MQWWLAHWCRYFPHDCLIFIDLLLSPLAHVQIMKWLESHKTDGMIIVSMAYPWYIGWYGSFCKSPKPHNNYNNNSYNNKDLGEFISTFKHFFFKKMQCVPKGLKQMRTETSNRCLFPLGILWVLFLESLRFLDRSLHLNSTPFKESF